MQIINNLKFNQAVTGVLTGCILLFQVSCEKDSDPAPPPPVVTDQSFTQNFESMSDLTQQGWVLRNLSDTSGGPGQDWSIESETLGGQTPSEGTGMLYGSYASATDYGGNISNWLISPKLYLQNGDKISFYTLSSGSIDGYGDRLQLRLNVFNTSDSIGTTSSDIGQFTIPLLDINPLYKITPPGDYPSTWTKYEATITGLNRPDSGRFALRYFVEINDGVNSDEIAVDKLEFKTAGH